MKKPNASFWAILPLVFLFIHPNLQAEGEPNGSFGTANHVGVNSTVTGAINPGNDKDFFWFVLDQAGALQMQVTNVAPELNLRLYLYDETGSELTHANSSGYGQSISFNDIICTPGKYFVQLRNKPFFGGASDQEYVLTIELNIDDVYECNNSISAAAEIGIETIYATIGDDHDRDFFKFQIPEAGVLSVRLNDVPIEVKAEATLYDPDINEIASGSANHGESMSFDKIVCKPGETYYIQVRNASFVFGHSHELYSLSLELVSNDPYECNNSIGNAYPFGLGTLQATIGDRTDRDFFSFKAPGAGTLQIKLTDVPSVIDPEVVVYNSTIKE